jgi:hypothetical protein
MWRFVSYPLSMMAGINGIIIASCYSYINITHTPPDPISISWLMWLGSIAGLVAGAVQSVEACKSADERNEARLKEWAKHQDWRRIEDSKASDWKREQDAKEQEHRRQQEIEQVQATLKWKQTLDQYAGPDPDALNVSPIKTVGNKER